MGNFFLSFYLFIYFFIQPNVRKRVKREATVTFNSIRDDADEYGETFVPPMEDEEFFPSRRQTLEERGSDYERQRIATLTQRAMPETREERKMLEKPPQGVRKI